MAQARHAGIPATSGRRSRKRSENKRRNSRHLSGLLTRSAAFTQAVPSARAPVQTHRLRRGVHNPALAYLRIGASVILSRWVEEVARLPDPCVSGSTGYISFADPFVTLRIESGDRFQAAAAWAGRSPFVYPHHSQVYLLILLPLDTIQNISANRNVGRNSTYFCLDKQDRGF